VSHTYSVLEISLAAFDEIKRKLEEAEYHHAFHDDLIDMHGIALKSEAPYFERKPSRFRCDTCGGQTHTRSDGTLVCLVSDHK
jgi:hypothetical protein